MKRTLIVVVLTLCCVVVIAMATQHETEVGVPSRSSASGPQYLADGNPQPPLPPPEPWLVADGNPQPPLPPFPPQRSVGPQVGSGDATA